VTCPQHPAQAAVWLTQLADFDIAIVNEDEPDALGRHRPPVVIVTLGARGRASFPADKSWTPSPPPRSTPPARATR